MRYKSTLCRIPILAAFFLVASVAIAQDKGKTISIQDNNISIKDAFSQIEQQTSYSIAYEQSEVDVNRKLSLSVKDEKVGKVVSKIISGTDLTYKISGYHIIISRAQNKDKKQASSKSGDQTITVRIIDEAMEIPVSGVTILGNNKMLGITDEQGYFVFDALEELKSLSLSRVGYENKVVELNSTKTDKVLTIYLSPQANSLQEVVITSNKSNKVYTTQMGAISMNRKELKSVPTVFGEADVIKVLQTQPGVSAGVEGLAGMYVRGGNNDENLLMIDGNPLYQVNHLGGLFSSFNVEAIENVDFYKSAFPAKYGGRLSSVMNVETKRGSKEKYHGAFSLGLTSGNINIGGPIVKDKTSFNFSVRRSWLDLLTVPALSIMNSKDQEKGKETIGRYAFTDVNLRLDHTFNPKSNMYFVLYNGSDYLKIGEREFSPNDDEDSYEKKDVNRLRWGNLLTALGWTYKFNRKLDLETVVSYTHYNSKIKESSYAYLGGSEKDKYMKRTRENNIDDIAFRTSFTYLPVERHAIGFGLNYTHHRYVPERITDDISQDVTSSPIHPNNIINANEASLFVEDDWKIAPQVRVNAGLRFNVFAITDKTYFSVDPRISARFLLTEALSLKTSYAHMTQFVQQISDSYISLPTDFWMPINKNFKPLNSDQVSLGLYYNLNNQYSFSIEGYHKWMKNLLEYKDGYILLPVNASWDSKLTDGKGTAYGLDMSIEKRAGKFKGSLGYGLMWTDRYFENINKGRHFPSKYDNRHKINITGSYAIRENMDINFSWMFMTGNKVTLALENYQDLPSSGFPPNIAPSYPYPDGWGIDYYESKNNVRLPAYHRLDLGLNIYQPKKNGRLGIWNVSVYNAYCYMNPIVIQKSTYLLGDGSFNTYPKFQSLSILPILPSVSYTYKF